MLNGVALERSALAEFGRRNHVPKPSLSDSILSDYGPVGDVDMLVALDPAAVVGLIKLTGLAQRRTGSVGRKVDLRTPQELSVP